MGINPQANIAHKCRTVPGLRFLLHSLANTLEYKDREWFISGTEVRDETQSK